MRISLLASALLIFAVPMAAAQAQEPSSETIRCQLDPSCTSGTTKPTDAHRRYRSIDPSGGASEPKQNMSNLNVPFEFNSAILQTDARITLDNLGKALSDPSLAGYRFLIGGHTDAKGNPSYNQLLSERRARAVRDYLVDRYHIPANKLTTKGYGSVQLLDPDHPLDGVNRRVQIVNLTVPGPAK